MNKPPHTLVKICGLRDCATASAMSRLHLPVDYVGLVFAPSKRRVDAVQAKAIMDAFGGAPPRFVGVFVNPSLDELGRVLHVAPLDVIQLHGDETPEFCQEARGHFPQTAIWKAFGVRGEDKHEEASVFMRLNPYAGLIDAILLDTWDPHVGGGTGITFRWDAIPAYRKWADRNGVLLLAAGGLHADNVLELLASAPVSAVDVSSGVETEGVKDIEKVRIFTERVKGRT